MSSAMQDILTGIKTDLEQIQAGGTVDVQGATYTFQTDLGFNVGQGVSLVDDELDQSPSCSINSVVGTLQSLGEGKPEAGIVLMISIEAATHIEFGDFYSNGCAMLEDIRAAVNLKPGSDQAEIIQPGAPGRPVFEFLKPGASSDIVKVRRWYNCLFVETYPYR